MKKVTWQVFQCWWVWFFSLNRCHCLWLTLGILFKNNFEILQHIYAHFLVRNPCFYQILRDPDPLPERLNRVPFNLCFLWGFLFTLPAAGFANFSETTKPKVDKKLFHIECLPVLNTVKVYLMFVLSSSFLHCFYSFSDLFGCRTVS